MKHISAMLLAIIAGSLGPSTEILAQTPPKQAIEARLTVLTSTLREDSSYKIRIELENVSDQVILIGRDLTPVNNWPFRIEIALQDSSGNQYGMGGAGFIDLPPVPDFSIKDGLLKWWMPLAPHTFIGTYVTAKLSGVPRGRYKLHGKYVVIRPPHEDSDLEHALLASKILIFQGTVETNSTEVEVLPKREKNSKADR